MIDIIEPIKIAIYENTKGTTMDQVKKETGCTHIMNGGFFDSLTSPCPILKINGVVKAASIWNAWGMSWNEAKDCSMSNSASKKNFISCVDLVNPWEGSNALLHYNTDVGGYRERTAWGILNNGKHLLYCDNTARTPENLRDFITEHYDIRTLLMLDGGGSVQGIFDGKGKVTSPRLVANFICFWVAKATDTVDKAVKVPESEKYGIKFSKEQAEQIAKILGGEIYEI